MLKFYNKSPTQHQPTTPNNSNWLHCSKVGQVSVHLREAEQQTACSIQKRMNKMSEVERDKKKDAIIQINFKQILQNILPQFCVQSLGQCEGLNQNTNELLSNQKRQRKRIKLDGIHIQMYGIWATETSEQKPEQVVSRKELPNMKWGCMDSIEVQNRYIIYAIGGQISNTYFNADASVEISIILYDKYACNFSIVLENAVRLQLEYQFNDYLRVNVNRRVQMVTLKWINSNLLICGLSNGCVVLINIADLFTNTTSVAVERLSVSEITEIKILPHLMERMTNHQQCTSERLVAVLTKDQQLFIINVMSTCQNSNQRRKHCMMILYKYYTLLGTQMVSKYEQLKQQRCRQTKYLTIIEEKQVIKIVQGSRSGIIKLWMIPMQHLSAYVQENIRKTKASIRQDEVKQNKQEQVKHKEEDLKSVKSEIKQNLQKSIMMINEDTQVQPNQKTTNEDTDMKDTDTSHGCNQQMELQVYQDKQSNLDIDITHNLPTTLQCSNNQVQEANHQYFQKLHLNHQFNHQSLIPIYEQLSHNQKQFQNQSNEQPFVKAPPLKYSITPTSIITSLFYDTHLLELQSFGKFLVCITANGFLTILAIDEDTCKRSQIQNEFRNNFFGQISEAYQIVLENQIFYTKKQDEKWYEEYVGMKIKNRDLYVMINKIWERRKKIEEVQCYIKIIKMDQKYRIKKIKVILLSTGGPYGKNRNKISYFEIRDSKIIYDCFKMRHKKYKEGKKCQHTISDVFVASFQDQFLQRYMNVIVQSEHIYYEEETRKDRNQQILKKQLSNYNKKYQINHWNINDQYLSTDL